MDVDITNDAPDDEDKTPESPKSDPVPGPVIEDPEAETEAGKEPE